MKRLKEDNLKHFFAEETLKKYSVVFIIILAVMLICELFIFIYTARCIKYTRFYV